MKSEYPRKLFLLGGYDLEMLTIRQMLEGRHGCEVIDRHLRWDNARLSAYQHELQQYADNVFYGIELKEDIPLPAHYVRIDHHNEWNDNPSALEQVADILGVTLDRYQRLVAANDKGYIPAMTALGASEDEIARVRRKDRAAQGVTAEDERLAEQSVINHLTRYGDMLVVRSLTPRFSPICDRLFPYRRLLVYTDTELMFYGEGKVSWVGLYADEISRGKMFHGGGDNGYIGTVAYAYGKEQINQFVEQIIYKYVCL